MPFGEVVCGAPGSGKSTYCYGKHQLFTALGRPIAVVNLDPANEHIPYPCAVDIAQLITLDDAMAAHGLGPNGAMLFCIEYLEANVDWLEGELARLPPDAYVLFDLPGQVELSTNHESVRRVVRRLARAGFRLAAVHLCDAHYVTDAAKYVSVLMLSLRAMLHLELPHVNVLSKVDLIRQYGELDFNLDFYTEVQDLSYLETALESASPRYAALNMAICGLIEDFGLVGFETLAVEDKESMLHLMRVIDKATGCVFVPPPTAPAPPGTVPVPASALRDLPAAIGTRTSAAPSAPSAHAHRHPLPRVHPSSSPSPPSHPPSSQITASPSALLQTADSPADPAGNAHALPPALRPNAHALFSSAAGPIRGPRADPRDVQERWVDAREEWDAWERAQWAREGEAVRAAAAAAAKEAAEGVARVRERK